MPFFKKDPRINNPYDMVAIVKERVKEMEQNGQAYFCIPIPEGEYERVHAWCDRNGISMLASHITDGRITYLFRKIR